MRQLLVALLGMSLAAVAPVSAQVLEKAAPAPAPPSAVDDAQFLLTRQHRVGMTHARRVVSAGASEKEDAAREIGLLGDALDASVAATEEVARLAGPEYATQVEAIRKCHEAALKHMVALKALVDRPTSAAAKSEAEAVFEQLDLAYDAQQKLIKAMAAPKPDSPRPPS